MKVVLRIFSVLVVLILLAVVAAFFFPRAYRIERAIEINASPEAVFAHIGDLKAWKQWTAWHERDRAMKLSYSTPSAGVGAWSAWESRSEGNGRMTVTTFEPPKRLVYSLEFPDMAMVSSGTMEIRPEEKAVRVVWISEGDLGMNPMHRWFGLFLDKLIGTDFEKGLARLKAVTEGAK